MLYLFFFANFFLYLIKQNYYKLHYTELQNYFKIENDIKK